MLHFSTFLSFFIPLFFAIDPLGLVPLILSVTTDLPEQRKRRVILEAVIAAFVISVAFMFVGQAIFNFLHITSNDFRIAGGILLLVFAVLDLIQTGKPAVHPEEITGIVPLAMPLIAGPATLTTVLVLSTRGDHAHWWTTAALLANFGILHAVMLASAPITRILGANALKGLSKFVMIILAAIAVNFIRTGIANIIAGK